MAERGRVPLYALFFDFNRAELKPESKPQLQELAKYLRSDSTLKVFVVGHTDGKGTFDYNRDLSLRRAMAVVESLQRDYQISASRLSPQGIGPLAPLASNDSDEGRALNRRVELVKRID
jgi:OmpA-OmpF porin, OOP family